MAKKRIYLWYLEPIGAWTNGVIARCCAKEDFLSEVICADGRRHSLWRCAEEVRDAVVASKIILELKFRIFCREGNGEIRNVSFLFKRKRPMKKPTNIKSAHP